MSQDTALFVTDENQSRSRPILMLRRGFPPMPAPARPRCWCAGCSGSCWQASKPERILCLTYTKNAAAEMENRLLKELANWATELDRGLTQAD